MKLHHCKFNPVGKRCCQVMEKMPNIREEIDQNRRNSKIRNPWTEILRVFSDDLSQTQTIKLSSKYKQDTSLSGDAMFNFTGWQKLDCWFWSISAYDIWFFCISFKKSSVPDVVNTAGDQTCLWWFLPFYSHMSSHLSRTKQVFYTYQS